MKKLLILLLLIPSLSWGDNGRWVEANPSDFISGIKFSDEFIPKIHKALFLTHPIVEGREIDYKDDNYFIHFGYYHVRRANTAWYPTINFNKNKFIQTINGETPGGFSNRLLFDRKIQDYDITEWTKAKNFKKVNAKGGKIFSFKINLNDIFFCNAGQLYIEKIYSNYPTKITSFLFCNKLSYLDESELRLLGKSIYWEDKRLPKKNFKSKKIIN